MIPRFAEPILKARKAGMRPEAMVLVSDGIQGLHWKHPNNPVIAVDPEKKASAYDFRCLAGLEVEIATTGDDRRAKALAWAIAQVRPDYLRVLFYDTGAMWRIIAFGVWSLGRESDWVCGQ